MTWVCYSGLAYTTGQMLVLQGGQISQQGAATQFVKRCVCSPVGNVHDRVFKCCDQLQAGSLAQWYQSRGNPGKIAGHGLQG